MAGAHLTGEDFRLDSYYRPPGTFGEPHDLTHWIELRHHSTDHTLRHTRCSPASRQAEATRETIDIGIDDPEETGAFLDRLGAHLLVTVKIEVEHWTIETPTGPDHTTITLERAESWGWFAELQSASTPIDSTAVDLTLTNLKKRLRADLGRRLNVLPHWAFLPSDSMPHRQNTGPGSRI
nr:hypothetical protein [Streptomyces tsukubensis NRRL18488]